MTTAFIAQYLGLLLLFVSLSVLFNRDHAIKVAHDLMQHGASQFIAGIVTVLVGLFVVLLHTSWIGWEIVVTLTGWFLLVLGVFRLWCPASFAGCLKKHGDKVSGLAGVFFLIVSLLLLYVGFVV